MNIAPFSYFSNKINQVKSFSNSVNFASRGYYVPSDYFERQYDNEDEIERINKEIEYCKKAIKATESEQKELEEKQGKFGRKLYSEEKEQRKGLKKRLKHQTRQLKEYEYCLNVCKNGPKTAVFADKSLKKEKLERICIKLGLVGLDFFAYKLGVDGSVAENWRKSGAIGCYRAEGPRIKEELYVIDRYEKKTREFLDNFIQRQADLLTPEAFMKKYSISFEEYRYLQTCGKLKFFGIDECTCSDTSRCDVSNVLVDTKDEKTIETIETIKKSRPRPSRFMKKDKIPASYLQGLGFADMDTIAQCISDGSLKGSVVKEEKNGKTSYKIFVDNSEDNKRKLKSLRKENNGVIEITELAKQTKRPVLEIQKAILDGKLKIIPYYILGSDEDKVFISTKNKKNLEYITEIRLEENI